MIYLMDFSSAGIPATGLTPTIDIYKKISDGTDVTPVPTVSEIGGGFYKFTAAPAEALAVRMNGGGALSNADKYKVMQITPNDGSLDAAVSTRALESGGNIEVALAKITTAFQVLTNRLVINRDTGAFILYADDGVTSLATGTIEANGRTNFTWL